MQSTTGLWLRTPPAIFPPILGLFGLGLAWRRASEIFSVPAAFGEILQGAVSLLFLAGVVAYLGKFVRRPGSLMDDLKIMPGRAGISTGSMAAMLFAATLAPYSSCAAKAVLIAAFAAHLVVIVLVLRVFWNAPFVQRRITPVWHLTFVGVIVTPVAAIPLGWTGLAEVIFFISLAMAMTIWVGSIIGLIDAEVPPPLRPTLAIHLAPVALLGIVAFLLGYGFLSIVFGVAAIALVILLLFKTRYLIAAGFSPFWGAFTFPAASFATLMLLLAQSQGGIFQVIAAVALIAATISTPSIAYRIVKMWMAGTLAVKTNASQG